MKAGAAEEMEGRDHGQGLMMVRGGCPEELTGFTWVAGGGRPPAGVKHKGQGFLGASQPF